MSRSVRWWTRALCAVALIGPVALQAQTPPVTPPPTQPPASPPAQPPVQSPALPTQPTQPGQTPGQPQGAGQPPTVVVPGQPTEAQAAAQAATGKSVSNEQITDAIKNSGLTQQQIRDKLKASGYDPSLADPFFAPGAGQAQPGVTAPGSAGAAGTGAAPQAAFVRALTELGILSTVQAKPPDETPVRTPDEDLVNRARATARAGGLFGKDVFAGVTSAFDPVTSGPVDPSYRLGVGDQVQLVVTGQVELGYALDVRRDGTVIIPQVGQIELAGLTLDGARALLKSRMGRSYSGLNNGEANLDLTVSRVRANSVFVIGEVENPGSYQVNALSTVFYALARAGGPTSRGSFRSVQVRRGGQLLRTIDLYDYLVRGDASNDIRTEQGDIIFVPLDTRAVAITGAVRRPGVFELLPSESFSDLLDFSGGLLTTASLDRIQIDRVLPPDQRKPGFERVKIDIPLHGKVDTLRSVALHDSDIITVFSIGDLRRNTVTIAGAVFQPGDYEITGGMTLDSLLKRAQGTLPWALTDRIKLRRQLPATGRTESYSLDLNDSTARRFPLAEFDEIEVLDGRIAYPAGSITIGGAVRRPFEGPYVEHALLKDVVDLAGGFEDYALVDRIKVERQVYETGRAELFSVDFRTDSGKAFGLERGDHVTVLDARTAFPARTITLSGALVSPGEREYVLNETLKDAVERAGGLKEEAAAIIVSRRRLGPEYNDTTSVQYPFTAGPDRAMPASASSFILEPDDHIIARAAPGFREQRFAGLEGLFEHVGAYPITENHDRLRDIVRRAGGTLPGAYDKSFTLARDGKVVAVDFAQALRGDPVNNVLLHGGDVLRIGPDPKTVFVTGQVSRPSLIVYRPGLSVRDYIELSGGPTDTGAVYRAVVDYPSGFSKRVKRVALFFHSSPEVVSGSVITVPTLPPSTSSSEAWTRAFQSVTALATLVIAYKAVTR